MAIAANRGFACNIQNAELIRMICLSFEVILVRDRFS
jgi:hypothetical protein